MERPDDETMRRLHESEWPVQDATAWLRHVYVIQEGDDGPVKVGRAANAFWRRSELQCGNPRKLHVRAVFLVGRSRAAAIEAAVHERFAGEKLTGEWLSIEWRVAAAVIAKLGGL